jgi:hypothetical protein
MMPSDLFILVTYPWTCPLAQEHRDCFAKGVAKALRHMHHYSVVKGTALIHTKGYVLE